MLRSLALRPPRVRGGSAARGTVLLRYPAPPGGLTVALSTSNTSVAQAPRTLTVPAGRTAAVFAIGTRRAERAALVVITAASGVSRKQARLSVRPQ